MTFVENQVVNLPQSISRMKSGHSAIYSIAKCFWCVAHHVSKQRESISREKHFSSFKWVRQFEACPRVSHSSRDEEDDVWECFHCDFGLKHKYSCLSREKRCSLSMPKRDFSILDQIGPKFLTLNDLKEAGLLYESCEKIRRLNNCCFFFLKIWQQSFYIDSTLWRWQYAKTSIWWVILLSRSLLFRAPV